jgi:hypothetical protein
MRIRIYWNVLQESVSKMLHKIREPWRDGEPPKVS